MEKVLATEVEKRDVLNLERKYESTSEGLFGNELRTIFNQLANKELCGLWYQVFPFEYYMH